jgi:acetyl-CoA acetyltransferase family protein
MSVNGGRNQGRPVVILGGVRTPFAKAGTELRDVSAVELGRVAAQEAVLRLEVPFDAVDEVVFGNIAQPANAANVARVIALRAGFPITTPAVTVCRNCASGMEAVARAYDRIRLGEAELVLAGGTESMSNIPLLFPRSYSGKLLRLARARNPLARAGAVARFRPRDLKPVIALEEGLTDPVSGLNMGETAERLARDFGISREEQDRYALESHRRTVEAAANGILAEEIVPLFRPPDMKRVAEDVGPRANQTLEALAKLRPYFDRHFGTVTVGNSCPITDGACALLLSSQERAAELGIEPLATVRSYAFAGCRPEQMGLGPVYAAPRALDEAGLRLEEIDRIEMNEAFAAQVIANLRAFRSAEFAREELGRPEPVGEIDPQKLNVNGGAIALGHPVGTSGARLVLTLALELRRKGLRRGLATLCVGGGQGGAMVIERG